MRVRVITLGYDDGLQGFPQEPLERLAADGGLVEVREHFFIHQGVPHLALVAVLNDGHAGASGNRALRIGEDLEKEMSERDKPVYRVLRRWRNERARAEGIPSYVILRNAQLAEIARRRPRTLADLRQVEGGGRGDLCQVREGASGTSS